MKKRLVSLSTVMNEEDTIEMAIRSILSYSDQVVILDSGSTDDTVKIARSIDPKVTVHVIPQRSGYRTWDWKAEELSRRKISLSLVPDTEWILFFDGDEVMDDRLECRVDSLLNASEKVLAYGMSRLHYKVDLWHCAWPMSEYRQCRIARKKVCSFDVKGYIVNHPVTKKHLPNLPYPAFTKTDMFVHHFHFANWPGKKHYLKPGDPEQGSADNYRKISSIEELPGMHNKYVSILRELGSCQV